MFQRVFGFLPPALTSLAFAPQLAPSVPARARLAPSFEGLAPVLAWAAAWVAPCSEPPFPNFSPPPKILVRLAWPHTASHTPPQPSSKKNPSPSHLTGCASRFSHPCSDAAPAERQIRAPRRCTP